MHKSHVYIIVLNYQQWEDTKECMESILGSSYPHYSVLVIDNHSPNRSMEHLIKWTGSETTRQRIGDTVKERKSGYIVFNREQFESVPDVTTLPLVTFIQND